MTAFCDCSLLLKFSLAVFLYLTLILQCFLIIRMLYFRLLIIEALVNFAFLCANVYILFICSKAHDAYNESLLCRIPYIALLVFALIAIIFALYSLFKLNKKSKKVLSVNSVKEAIDNLPCGVCIFNASGIPILCNHVMHRLSFELTGNDINSLEMFKTSLEKCALSDRILIPKEKNAIYIIEDKKAWRFSKNLFTDSNGNSYTQILASDITQLYERKLMLDEENKKLTEITRNLKALSKNVAKETHEAEILSMKMKVHDEIGRNLTATRRLITLKRPLNEAEPILSSWNKTVKLLVSDTKERSNEDMLTEVIDAAYHMGIEIRLNGEFCSNEKEAYIIICAIRECATNAVRHANASTLYVDIKNSKDNITAIITNDGIRPENDITEEGGLSTLRKRVLRVSGEMHIISRPAFSLSVSIPLSKEEIGL